MRRSRSSAMMVSYFRTHGLVRLFRGLNAYYELPDGFKVEPSRVIHEMQKRFPMHWAKAKEYVSEFNGGD